MRIKKMVLFPMIFIFFSKFVSCSSVYEGRDIDVFVSIVSGRFSNAKSLTELREDGFVTAQSLIEVYTYPINYPALESDFVLFFNELQDGNVTRQQYVALHQFGSIIHMDNFNFARSDFFNQGFVDVAELESFKVEDLKIAPVCQSFVQRIGETIFAANHPNCNIDGYNSVTYKITHTCDTLTFFVDSPNVPESMSRIPYILNKVESYNLTSTIVPDYNKYMAMCH